MIKQLLSVYEDMMNEIDRVDEKENGFEVFFKDYLLSIEITEVDSGTLIKEKTHGFRKTTEMYLPIHVSDELKKKFQKKMNNNVRRAE